MASPRVSFTTPPPLPALPPSPHSDKSSFIAQDDGSSRFSCEGSLELPEPTLDLNDVKTLLGNLLITSERLAIVEMPIARSFRSSIFRASLDEGSEAPRAVAVKHFIQLRYQSTEGHVKKDLQIPGSYPLIPDSSRRVSEALKVRGGLKHPNVLELLGCSQTRAGNIRLISPYLIHGNIRQYLAQAPVGIAQRLGFVRDLTAGLDYLHSRRPPICHGNLNPLKVLIDDNLNAVLGGFEPVEFSDNYANSPGKIRFTSPENVIEEDQMGSIPSDVWSWGCSAFEILTSKQPFHEHQVDSRVMYSIVSRHAPGQPEMLLDFVPDVPKPEYASTLRLLHSYLPLCWEYEPRKRPPISLVRRQAFMFSFDEDAGDSVVATLEELAHLLISPDRLRIIERSELGAGSYGEVVLGTLDEASSTPRDVAVKRLKAVGTRGERARLAKRLARELNVWAKIRHPNVVELIGYYLDDKYESPLLISALMTNGNVWEYIERFKPDVEQRIAFVKGITAGLECLHNFDPPICHGDLKPANVLIDLRMNAVLCDFGLASFVGGSPELATTTTIKGTPRYMSPELHFDGDCTHSLESDVWAWACTVFEVLTSSIPYAEALGEAQLCMAIVKRRPPGDVTLLLPNKLEGVDSESVLAFRYLQSTLPQCWDFEPQLRPSMRTLFSQISNLSSDSGIVVNWSDEVSVSGEGARLLKGSKAPSGEPANHDQDAQKGRNSGLEDASQGSEVTEENGRETQGKTETQEDTKDHGPVNHRGAEADNRAILIGAYPGDYDVTNTSIGDQNQAVVKEDIDADEQGNEGRSIRDDPPTDIASSHLSSNVSTPALGKRALGIACIFALSAITYSLFRASDSWHPPGPASNRRGDFHAIANQPLSAFILPAAFFFILSLCANIFFVYVYFILRKVDSLPPRDQARPAT